MQTLKPRLAAEIAVARPMPRLPPVMIATLSVKACPPCTLLEKPHQHRYQREDRNEPDETSQVWDLDEIKQHIEDACSYPNLGGRRAQTAISPGHDQRQRQGRKSRKSLHQIAEGTIGATCKHAVKRFRFVARTSPVFTAELQRRGNRLQE